MQTVPLLLVGLTIAADSPERERDVHEVQTRKFALPIHVDPGAAKKVAKIRLYVSEDRGKAWRHVSDHAPGDKDPTYTAASDGLYWFSFQIVFKDGKNEPASLDKLAVATKVYVNSERKTLKAQKSYEELQREVEELRKTVEELKRRLAEVETGRKGK